MHQQSKGYPNCKQGSQGVKNLWCSLSDFIYIQNEVRRKKGCGVEDPPCTNKRKKGEKTIFATWLADPGIVSKYYSEIDF